MDDFERVPLLEHMGHIMAHPAQCHQESHQFINGILDMSCFESCYLISPHSRRFSDMFGASLRNLRSSSVCSFKGLSTSIWSLSHLRAWLGHSSNMAKELFLAVEQHWHTGIQLRQEIQTRCRLMSVAWQSEPCLAEWQTTHGMQHG